MNCDDVFKISFENRDIKNVLNKSALFLKSIGIKSYRIDAEVILMYTTGFSKVQLFTKNDYIMTQDELNFFVSLINQRALGKPVQYIVGVCEFMSLDFDVNKYTLIPRNDTEILVEKTIEYINKNNYRHFIDIGTGSGAIAISILKYCPNVVGTAIDISKHALETAFHNAKKNGVSERINFIESDIFSNVPSKKYDLIVSNPPYIKTSEIKFLSCNVKDFEPFSALDGGDDGLYFYRKIVNSAKKYLNIGGMIFFEIGYEQKDDVFNILSNAGFINISCFKDLSGLNRVVTALYA